MISIRLKELADAQQISQREVWRRAQKYYPQLTWAALNHFANKDTSGVSYVLLEAVCRALRCQPGDLLCLEAPKRLGQRQAVPSEEPTPELPAN